MTAVRHATLLERIARTPFYRGRLGESARGQLPLTRREELVRDQREHLPWGTRRFTDAGAPVRVGVAGSGDALLVLAWSAAALARERAAGARLLRGLGVAAGTRVANSLPGALDGAAWQEAYLYSRSVTISSGTSEILRTLLAERALGLPRG